MSSFLCSVNCPFPELATVMGESRSLLCYDCLQGDGGHDDGGHDHMSGAYGRELRLLMFSFFS